MTCNGNGEVASGKVACGEVVSGYVVTNYVAWPNTGIRVGMDQVMVGQLKQDFPSLVKTKAKRWKKAAISLF
ncbi:hypothetical protein ACOSQ3_006458 [Xanthoceras sorbifolium]